MPRKPSHRDCTTTLRRVITHSRPHSGGLGNPPKSFSADRDELEVQAEADRVVLSEYAPVGVVINGEMEVVQFRGQTSPYLAPPPGKPSLNVLKLARYGLAIELRSLINNATKMGVTLLQGRHLVRGEQAQTETDTDRGSSQRQGAHRKRSLEQAFF